jgi:transcriptional regulator with XRE-family HTH domain
MRQTSALLDALKRELKRQGKTYRDVAEALQLSEASVKRLFSRGSFSLDRLDRVCELLDIEFGRLVRLMERDIRLTTRLTLEQERELVSDIKLLLMAHFLINGLSFADIIALYDISEPEGIRLLARLDRMKIIELLPGNRVKVTISEQFEWIPNGPIQNFYERSIQSDFLKSSFRGPGEFRIFVSGLLTRSSNVEIIRKIRRITADFSELNREDQAEAPSQRFGTSLIVAMRPWEPVVFTHLRRNRSRKVF